MTLNELFKNTTYDDTLFSVETKSTIESRIFMKSVRGSEVPYITCAIRDKEIKLTPEEEKAYLWFISFVYRLRNALFHEIIDPLNDEWQVIFKNSYHVLKQIVDQNIWRLKQLKLLPLWKNVLTCLTSISHLLTGGLRSKASR